MPLRVEVFADVRNHVLLRCCRDMEPIEVVACAKELLANKTIDVPELAATPATTKSIARTSRTPSGINNVVDTIGN